MEPLVEDTAIRAAAHACGIHEIYAVQVLDVDMRRLPARFKRTTYDSDAIRRAIAEGEEVPGVRITGDVKYVLRSRNQPQPAAALATSSAITEQG